METNTMSEENNLESDNLCTTEDAFEKFQAVAMFEEDEFITLSDIVPPQPVVPDLSNELNEIPYDNEVILDSTQSNDPHQINSIIESSQGLYNEPEKQHQDIRKNNTSVDHKTESESKPKKLDKNIKNKKVGRRRKQYNENHQTDQSKNSSVNEFLANSAFTDNQAIQDSVLSTTVGKNGTDPKNDTQVEPIYPRRTRRGRISNTSKYPLIPETVKNDTITETVKSTPGKRRGRPKKALLENSTISEPDSTNIDSSPSINENLSYTKSIEPDESIKSAIKRGKRGRPKKSLLENNVEQVKVYDSSNNLKENNSNLTLKNKKLNRREHNKNETTDKLLEIIEDSELKEATNVQLPVSSFCQPKDNTEPLDDSIEEDVPVDNYIDDKSANSSFLNQSSNVVEFTAASIAIDKKCKIEDRELLHKPDNLDFNKDGDDADDIFLSKLKENFHNGNDNLNENVKLKTENDVSENSQSDVKINFGIPATADFEYNIDKMAKSASLDGETTLEDIKTESLLVEDTSKRPNRRKTKQNFKYDVDSDEDPFANVELSEDDGEPRTRKNRRYCSDDEYIPGKRRGMTSSGSDSEINEEADENGRRKKRKKVFKSFDNQSPKKRGSKNKSEIQAMSHNENQENVEESSLLNVEEEKLSMKPPAEAWATSNEFENFIAQKIQGTNLKIKKVSSKKAENIVTPLDIPVLDQNKPNKMIEISTQTISNPTTSTAMQTSVPYDIPMKTNMKLSTQQSEKACEFLHSVVKTTVELGQLMKEKSEDFLKKKINTDNVTDTFKMDYCVRKSFLLFKLAKHNLMQMEEDLAKQYDEFLNVNKLSSCRDKLNKVAPKRKADSDSDCEIVDVKEVANVNKKKENPKFNPKTVFLNKELSIKIAKKPSAEKNVDIKGRHTVWINDAVMVKKVKPTQSFLAQDSRNKKPPDYITEKMVSDFFNEYYRQKALAVCALYLNTEWSGMCKEYACHYFVKSNDFDDSYSKMNAASISMMENIASTSNGNNSDTVDTQPIPKTNPKSLSSLCTGVLCSCLHVNHTKEVTCNLTDAKNENQPLTLFRLCIQSISSELHNNISRTPSVESIKEDKQIMKTVLPLKSLCHQRIVNLVFLLEELSLSNNGEDTNEYYIDIDKNKVKDDVSAEDYYNDIYANVNKNVSKNTSMCDDDISSDESYSDYTHIVDKRVFKNNNLNSLCTEPTKNMKSLLLLCINSIQNIFEPSKASKSNINFINKIEKVHPMTELSEIFPVTESPKSLKFIVYEKIKLIMYGEKFAVVNAEQTEISISKELLQINENSEDFTINCINTMSDEAFHRLEELNEYQEDDNYDYELDIEDFDADNEIDENEWVSQVQMQELRSCITPSKSRNEHDDTSNDNSCATSTINTAENAPDNTDIHNDNQYQNVQESILDQNLVLAVQIKLEPEDDAADNAVDSSIVKSEPVHGLDGMTIIPESIVTKSEMIENGAEASEASQKESSAYDVHTFEQFVQANKMMRSMDDSDCSDSDQEIFSKSGLRIRRQHEPDNDAENDMNMSLLVPQTYEPLHIENAKGDLMESSSDENKDINAKKSGKRKIDRKKGKQKKGKEIAKNTNSKEVSTINKDRRTPEKDIPTPEKEIVFKEKTQSISEVTMLTRRMREKIRQEEKKIESSDSSDPENNVCLSLRKDKQKKENEIIKSTKKIELSASSIVSTIGDDEIQCNNVDSTEQISEGKGNTGKKKADKFTGFSAIDQNEISSYHKYMQFVFDKIVPGDEDSITPQNHVTDLGGSNQNSIRPSSPVINPEEPVELLECEPTMPIFYDEKVEKPVKQPKKIAAKKKENKTDKIELIPKENEKPLFMERNGWHLYNIDTADAKLYQNCHIPLEKLPESFVETYLEYHDITDRDHVDKEVDRLANLQTLNRAGTKEGKSNRKKNKMSSNEHSASEQNSTYTSGAASPTYSDHYDELTPSEDEGANAGDELPPPAPMRTTENYIAKDSLMDDHESDSDNGGIKKIKQELIDNTQVEVIRKPGPKSKTRPENKFKVDTTPSGSLMLTADKMMNKELSLLHAPIVLKEEAKEIIPKEPSPKAGTTLKRRSNRNISLRDRIQAEDDSSSEEEKQWVSTKEKLLKKMEKKEDTGVDDAKRAKLVDDFIERRGGAPGKRRAGGLGGSRRSRKKFLERLKQQRVLSKELYGEPSTDLTTGGKRSAATGLFKGRRNIRKVIDKKSLQKSTVLANMEEFERKRKLVARQNQLRELLGCEEGVNVLVINDEVCLEYDFQQQRPIVTVHPFFTKVMKAHQYEGVKFMWDACFESLEAMEAGRGGGGCILAHCMGLGKTLQVLALLHTVLTHPRAGMHRVLVCCPLSTVLNWVDEIHKWIGPVTDQIKVFELSKLKKTYERAYQLEDWYNGGGIFIIGYELFRSLTTLDPFIDEVRPTIINKIRTALLDPGPDIIICDEGHLLKNDCSVLAVAMSRVVTKRRIVLTGTPMQNNLREYYCMVNFVKPNLLGTYSEYSNRFENPIMNGQHRDSSEEDIRLMKARTHILHKVLEGCLQRQEASVLYPYLPKKHEYTVFIPLTKCQWDLYKHYVHHYTKKSKQSVLKDFHILQKIWSHPQVLHNFQIKAREDIKKKELKVEKIEDDLALEDKEDIKPTDTEVWWLQYLADGAMLDSVDSSNKFVAVFRILHECIALGDKVLIFSTSLFCLDALEFFLKQINGWSLGQEYYRLDGSVPAEVRQKWVREFNAENNVKTKLFLISTRAGCLGLNMTAANRVIILDTSWNPAHDIQSIFRVYRFGQKKDCYIYRLVAMGTMEQKIYERSVTKQAVACRVVDEQQIDRHYNMAELTELYRFDEFGSGVAGGVAVGVGDVALLRVARDAAVHAVHEHDSLLRGSGEQGLPEHERAAAWMQFQQEHAHKQMQNDLETDKAARALEKLQQKQLAQEQLLQQQHEQQKSQVLNIKTEDGPVHDSLVPKAGQPPQAPVTGRGGLIRGRGRKSSVVQCRIPIRPDTEPGPSRAPSPFPDEEEVVRQISEILVKHNFSENGKGPKQIRELVNKVKMRTQTGQPLDGCDELTASIANVLLKLQGKLSVLPASPPRMPALTDVELPRRGRTTKAMLEKKTKTTPTPTPLPPPLPPRPSEETAVGSRCRRKAAIAAERLFDMDYDCASQDSAPPDPVIDVDDDDWRAGSDTDSATETVVGKTPVVKTEPQSQKTGGKRINLTEQNADGASILLSDDEISVPEKTAPVASETEHISLHSSLLSNQNFIKIVAHTYLSGNPMLDEDAATLAARYSTFKLLKETESSGKPIESGPIYDIAIKVLGKDILRKLQVADQRNKSQNKSEETIAASNKLIQFLGQGNTAEPNKPAETKPVELKRKPGPRSRVSQIKEEPKELPKLGVSPTANLQQSGAGIVPVSLVHRSGPSTAAATAPAALDECILPDDDDEVRCVTDTPPPAPPATAPPPPASKPVQFKVRLMPVKKESVKEPEPRVSAAQPMERFRVTSAPPSASYTTINLDSDDDEPSPAPAPMRPSTAVRARVLAPHPVPVALTGPNSERLPLPRPMAATPPQATPPSQPGFYKLASNNYMNPVPVSMTGPVPVSMTGPVPVSMTGPDSRPVPISMTGPDSRPVPISLSGPGFQAMPISLEGQPSFGGVEPVPVSFGGGLQTVPMSFAEGTQSMPMTFTVPASVPGGRPVTMSLMGGGTAGAGGVRTMRLSVASGQGAVGLQQVGGNIFLVPAAPPGGERLLTRVPATQVPQALRVPDAPVPAPPPAPTPIPTATKTVCKPGDILRLTATGQLEVIQSGNATIHTIDDDEPVAPPPVSKVVIPKTNSSPLHTKTPAPKPMAKAPAAKPKTKVVIPSAPLPAAPILTPAQKAPAQKQVQPQPKASNSLLKPSAAPDRRQRKASSSSSSSSESSRSPSPDPLSILKDVVHIQAPKRSKTKIIVPTSSKTDASKQPPKVETNKTSLKPKPTTSSNNNDKRKDAVAQNLNKILCTVKTKNAAAVGSGKSTGTTTSNLKSIPKNSAVNIKDSIDLTDQTFTNNKAATPKNHPKGGKPTIISKKDPPMTVVGTSKNIVLDGKSKSLTNKSLVDLTGEKSIQVTNVKTIPPSVNKPKPPEKKRSAPPPETAAPKKKKTEPMTLKDFDIDDIDDIIELD